MNGREARLIAALVGSAVAIAAATVFIIPGVIA